MPKSNRRRSLFKKLLIALFILSLPAGGFAFYWIATMPDVAALATTNPTSTALIERRTAQARAQGRRVYHRQRWVPLARISKNLQRAVIVAIQ